MKRLVVKFGLAVCLWYELMAEFHMESGTAFWAAMALVCFGWFAFRMSGPFIGSLGPKTLALLLQSVLWFVLLWWLAPPLWALPLPLDLFVLVVLAVMGARSRVRFELARDGLLARLRRDYSGHIVGAVLLALSPCWISIRLWGSLWPLIGYALLPGLPFLFGWRMVTAPPHDKPDARVGDADDFRDAGLSEER